MPEWLPSVFTFATTVLHVVDRYLTECFRIESPPRVGELAGRLRLSRVTLNAWFRQELHSTATAYLKARQIDYAKHLLETTDLSATIIAYRAGFGTRRTFFRLFRQLAACTPAEYRGAAAGTAPRSGQLRLSITGRTPDHWPPQLPAATYLSLR